MKFSTANNTRGSKTFETFASFCSRDEYEVPNWRIDEQVNCWRGWEHLADWNKWMLGVYPDNPSASNTAGHWSVTIDNVPSSVRVSAEV